MTETDLAYLAACLDMNGAIALRKSSHGYQMPVIQIHGIPAYLQLFVDAFGGKVYRNKMKDGAEYFFWRVTHTRAAAVAKQLLPYMRFRADLAARLVSWRPTPRGGRPIITTPVGMPGIKQLIASPIARAVKRRGFGRRA